MMRIGSTQYDLASSELKLLGLGSMLRQIAPSDQNSHPEDDPYLRAQLRSQHAKATRNRNYGATLLLLSLFPPITFLLCLWQVLTQNTHNKKKSNKTSEASVATAPQPQS